MHAGKCLPFSHRVKKVNLFVGRPNGGMSKPCSQCIKYLDNLCTKGYKVTNIFYTVGDHNILKTTLNKLKKEEQHVSSFYRNSKNITYDDCNDCDNCDNCDHGDHNHDEENEDEDEDGLADKRS